jgi:hypothetical protein
MKKIILFAVMASATLLSCSRSQIEEDATRDAVSFGAYSGRSITRAGETADMNQANLQTLGFGVFATYSGTADYTVSSNNFMYNQLVNYSEADAKWQYSPIKFWPNPTDGSSANDQKVSFFAYAPYCDPEAPGADNSYGITGFGIDPVTNHNLVYFSFASGRPNVDLMWGYKSGADLSDADPDADVNINLTRTTETIKFHFRHLLSKLGGSQDGNPASSAPNGVIIKANPTEAPTNGFASDNGTKITVQDILIESATQDQYGNPITYVADDALQTGKLDLYTGAISMDTAPQGIKFRQYLSADAAAVAAGASEIADNLKEIPNPATFAAVNPGVTTADQNAYKNEVDPIILIPGTVPVVDVTITYYVRTYDAKLPDKQFTEIPQTVTGKVTFPIIEAGKKYNLRIILGLMDASFEAFVDEWNVSMADMNGDSVIDENDNASVDLPGNL